MACPLLDTKPLPEPLLTYCQLQHIALKYETKCKKEMEKYMENAFENIICMLSAILLRSQCIYPHLSAMFSGFGINDFLLLNRMTG